MPIRFDFQGRKVILTGAAGAMGSRILQGYIEAGAKVFATDREGPAFDAIEGPSDQLFKLPVKTAEDLLEAFRTIRPHIRLIHARDAGLAAISGTMIAQRPNGETFSEVRW